MAESERAPRRVAGLALLLVSLLGGACSGPTPAPVPAPSPPLVQPDAPVPFPPCHRILGIEVSRSARRLRARCEGGMRVEMTVALGRTADGPKRISGDERTPEGDYRVSGAPRRSRFHLFIPIDYPSVADADRALADGRLSKAEYVRIYAAHAAGDPPPGNSALGGALGLHGEGKRWRGDSEHLDWTKGCIAVTDAEIAFLAERVELGTPVRIGP
jgi:murein L,D-transpeptidase YafK